MIEKPDPLDQFRGLLDYATEQRRHYLALAAATKRLMPALQNPNLHTLKYYIETEYQCYNEIANSISPLINELKKICYNDTDGMMKVEHRSKDNVVYRRHTDDENMIK